jgi:single-stranded DNA-binding protein
MAKTRMRGINIFVGTGTVGKVTEGQTSKGVTACSFTLGLPKDVRYTAWVRVNVFGQHVPFCLEHLKPGMRVCVQGELMNRKSSRREQDLDFTEVRCFDVQIVQ